MVSNFTALDCPRCQLSTGCRSVWVYNAVGACHCTLVQYLLACSFYNAPTGIWDAKILYHFWSRTKWSWVITSLCRACMSDNKLDSAHHSCLSSPFPVSCCTVFFTFRRFSIWSLHLSVFFIYLTLKGNFELLILSMQWVCMSNGYWNIRY